MNQDPNTSSSSLDALLQAMVDQDASDLHLAPDHAPLFRIDGHLRTVESLAAALSNTQIHALAAELIGESAAGRKQENHKFLYWELRGQVAVRMNDWKAIRPRKKAVWELYDLSTDVSESKNLASKHPEIMGTMQAFAEESHTPVEEGKFYDRKDL